MDVFMMLLAGFGFLMTFLKRYGMSALGFTMIVTVIVTQFSIIVFGFARLDEEFVIKLAFIDIVEGGVVAAAVLISFGVVIGKVNPLQLLFMGLIETIFVVLNAHIGYSILGVSDVGGTIFIHTFGAYFGLAVSFVLKGQDTSKSEHLEGSRQGIWKQLGIWPLIVCPGTQVTSSHFWAQSFFGYIGRGKYKDISFYFFYSALKQMIALDSSFNGILATEAARHRCYINTYIRLQRSIPPSTSSQFIVANPDSFRIIWNSGIWILWELFIQIIQMVLRCFR